MPLLHPRRTRGQAAVETALTLPLTIFLMLGTVQLFLMLQARLMAEHAVFRATRTGALAQGNCPRMLQSALTTLLPTFSRTNTTANLVASFADHKTNKYDPAEDSGHNGEIVWLFRESPLAANIAAPEQEDFDDPDRPQILRLEVRLVFWYPMRIPFANWVIARMSLAAIGLEAYTAGNPLMETTNANWPSNQTPPPDPGNMLATFQSRTGSPANTYVFPIQASAAMRMMTPPRQAYFTPMLCK